MASLPHQRLQKPFQARQHLDRLALGEAQPGPGYDFEAAGVGAEDSLSRSFRW
jgi:hypothetical protein